LVFRPANKIGQNQGFLSVNRNQAVLNIFAELSVLIGKYKNLPSFSKLSCQHLAAAISVPHCTSLQRFNTAIRLKP
jgi:hypothetical protein